MFTTADQPAVVARYYTDPNHHPGWTLEEMAGSFLVLEKGNQCLHIVIARDLNVLSRGKTTIMYTLENECG